MGKAHRRNNKLQRPSPTGIQSMKEYESENIDSGYLVSQKGALMGAMEKLQSGELPDRECGAEGLALVACNKEAIEELLQQDVVRIAAPLLLDSSPTVRHSIAGSLRNITAVGGPDVCDHFVQKDVMTSIVALYKRFYQNWRPAQPKEGKIDSNAEIFIEATNLLWNLCESSEQAVTIFNHHNLVSLFLPCLDVATYGYRITLVSAQCLQAVSDNNADLIARFPPDRLSCLVSDLMCREGDEPVHHHLRTLAAGIYLNLHGGKLTGCPANERAILIEVLAGALNVKVCDTVQVFKEKDDDWNNPDQPEENLVSGTKADGEEAAKDNIMNALSAKQVALEALTNVCCDDEGADDWESLSSSDAGDDMEVPMEEDRPSQPDVISLPDEVKLGFAKFNLVQLVEQHAIISEDILAQLASTIKGRDVLERLETMQCRALLCLHNMVTGSIQHSDGQNHLPQLLLKLAQLVLTNAGKGQFELLDASTGCLRAVIQKLCEEKSLSSVAHLTLDDLNALYRVAQNCPDAKVRVNILRIVATIGILLQCDKSTQSEPFIASIGEFLLELGLKDRDIWVNAEAADALMDVFAEDHLDNIAQQLRLVQKCRNIHSNLKTKGKEWKKQPGEHLPMVAMAKTNLLRFIKYKSKRTSNGQI